MKRTTRRRLAFSAALLLLATLTPTAVVAGPAAAGTQTAAAAPPPALTVAGLTTERATDPIGLDVARPRLGWRIESAARGVVQESYQVRVATSTGRLGDPDVWDSGRVRSRQSVLVPYGGPELRPRTRYVWQVRVWDTAGRTSGWSAPASWETGVRGAQGWQADWIGMPSPTESWSDYTLRTTVRLEKDAAGVYLRANGPANAYMWQLSIVGGAAKLRPHVRVDGAWRVLKEVPLGAVVPADKLTAPHTLRITAAGDTITTWVDGTQVDVTRDGTHRGGSVGLRTDGAETAVFSDFSVTSGDDTLFAAPLTDGENPFGGGTPTPDGLRVGGTTEAMLTALDANPLLRRGFRVDGEVARARIYATALGVYELSLNGQRVGDHELAPGWTDYDKRVQYQTYDVTRQLRQGENALGALVGDGWYSGTIASFGTDHYGNRPHLSAQLVVDYADGRTETVRTDGSWRATPGPFLQSDLIHGETYDARKLPAGWDRPGFDDSGWSAATVDDTGATDRLVAQVDPPVRVVQELPARTLTQPTPGTWIFDLGQNMVGKVRLKLSGPAGTTVRIRHAEVLNPDGTAYTANLRSARATDHYTLRGGGEEVYEPTFTFHGFRYVELTNLPGTPDLSTVTGLVMHTDGDLTSEFETSDPMVTKLHSNITWGQRGNFLSIPTDTPARDERLGWTGDINVFAETATFNMESLTFLTKWLQDLRDAQSANGAYPDVAPRACCGDGATGWADAGITVPWTLWQRYGDTRVIEEHYESMTRYASWLQTTSSGNRRTNAGPYLDWLNLDDPTPAGVIATAYYAYTMRLLGEMAAAIGRDADAARYAALSRDVAQAFVEAYVSADGTVQGDSQTGYVLAIGMGLLPEPLRAKAADRLVDNVRRHDWHLSTGFLGTPDLLPALSDTGHLDVAYRLLLNDTYPSWGYEIARGATTIWERWNSIMPDGSFGDVSMNSFNHYAYGAVGDWMYRTVAGIQPDPANPGYAHLTFAPQPGGGLTSARATYRAAQGDIGSDWSLDDRGDMRLRLRVPANVTATVRVPAPTRHAVTEGGRPAERADGVRFVRMDGGVAVYEIGSGTYSFAVDRALGDLGEAGEAVTALTALTDELAGELGQPVTAYLRARTGQLATATTAARTAYLAGDSRAAATHAHRGLATADDVDRWLRTQVRVGRLAEAHAERFGALLTRVDQRLSAASSALVGAVVTLDLPVGERLPGEVVRATVTVTNGGATPLTGVTSTLRAPDGWTVTPAGARPTTVAPKTTVHHRYDVRIPAGQAPAAVTLDGTAGYRYQGGTATLPVSGTVTTVPAVQIVSATVDPVDPGATTTVTTVLRNRAGVPVTGKLTTTAPDGWAVAPAAAYDLAPGAQTTVTTALTAPVAVTEGPAAVTVATGATEAERHPLAVPVRITNPPAGAYDHVDLGDAASERAHGLTASEHSGANTEAGLTRRYTNVTYPGGWFEFDLAVTPGAPFVLRAVETYDQAQLKDYDIVVDGVVAHSRSWQRTAGGAGAVTYQVVVDLPDATRDGVVRVRFRDTGDGYDPSIADVWSAPLPAGARS
ncbi:family 78 glycoside hydrolase catalytic domain [Micromonospora globbae]|uniref:family 78 glycoside hydrolase catalytic domain n=1 Tax=Micromonospora globbae TaxID=1894969 RepID=UPI00386DFA76|nr:family 78 glycoside hydrolase catalytic domain [Micromonospora globbae]